MIFEDWRWRNSFKAGKAEHWISRILGIFLLFLSFILLVEYRADGSFIPDIYLKYCCWMATILWIGYFLSHRIEKWLSPRARRVYKKS